jgi:hypothetical protein
MVSNMICSALRSSHGASYVLLRMLGTSQYESHLTVPFYYEAHHEYTERKTAGLAL